MANPKPISIICPENQWTLVATAVEKGLIHKKNTTVRYYSTYVATGDPAPTIADFNDLAVAFDCRTGHIGGKDPIDLYIWCKSGDGEVILAY